jgi:ubiquinol-cytochrome c reductase cytochrome b subunit
MGLAIAYSVLLAVPVIGANLALLIWGAPFPGTHAFESRMYVGHVLLLPILIGALLALHLALIVARHHTQFPGPRRSEGRVVGRPTFPGYAPRSIALFFAVTGVLFLLGGLVQINPVWQWGPYEVSQGTNGAQPDWYLGWLIGGLRLMPGFDVTIGSYTLVPNAFWAGVVLPLLVFGLLLAWPALERRLTGDHGYHNLLDRPRDNPWRTATGAAFFTWVACIFFAGASDRMFVQFDIPYTAQVWFWRAAVFVLPALVWVVTRRLCEELRAERPEPEAGVTTG